MPGEEATLEDRVNIETPEYVQVSYELAGIGSRGLACILDTVLQAVLVLLLVWGLVWLQYWLQLADMTGVIVAVVLGTATFMTTLIYYVVCEMTMNGQSPGKRMAGLRVVRVDGTPLTFTDSAIRNIIRLVDMLPLFYTVGLFAVFFTRRSQRLGDLAANTMVIKERVYEAPEHVEPVAGPFLAPDLAPELVARLRNLTHLLSEADCAAARRFVERRAELAPDLREQLAARLAEPLAARLPGMAVAEFPSAERFLEAILSLRQTRL